MNNTLRRKAGASKAAAGALATMAVRPQGEGRKPGAAEAELSAKGRGALNAIKQAYDSLGVFRVTMTMACDFFPEGWTMADFGNAVAECQRQGLVECGAVAVWLTAKGKEVAA